MIKTQNINCDSIQPALSICIATYSRGKFISQTIDSILSQISVGVELIVVDGASPDNTSEVMARYSAHQPNIKYFREPENSGVDGDYDKAVGYANGEYVWLMTDDDLLLPGAVNRVLNELRVANDLVIVNAEVRSTDLSVLLQRGRLDFKNDRSYHSNEREAFFAQCGRYLSFIGCVVIRRELWLTRERTRYYGSLFIHAGVIFQKPLANSVYVIAEPLIQIRFGNAMWTPRGFEIWMFKWPQLIWSFHGFSDHAKQKICPAVPSRSIARLFYYRALGAYGPVEFKKHYHSTTGWIRFGAYATSQFPEKLANLMCALYLGLFKRKALMALYDLSGSRNATRLSRSLARNAIEMSQK